MGCFNEEELISLRLMRGSSKKFHGKIHPTKNYDRAFRNFGTKIDIFCFFLLLLKKKNIFHFFERQSDRERGRQKSSI